MPEQPIAVPVKETRYIKAVNEALHEEMARDHRVFIAGEDVGGAGGAFSATRDLLKVFGPRRVRDTPISEAAIVGLAVGAAMRGLRPVVEIMFADFLALSMDQIVNQLAKARYMFGGMYTMPVVIRAATGGGLNAGPQHSQSLEAWFAHVPGLKVVMPSTPRDAKGLLKAAIRDDNPVIFLEHKALYAMKGEIPDGECLETLGKAEVRRPGKDVTIIAASAMVQPALDAAAALAQQSVDAEVIDLRTVSPLDEQAIFASVSKTGRLVVAHEAVKAFGFGAEIVARVAEELPHRGIRAARVGAPFAPVPFAQEKLYLPTAADVAEAAQRLMAPGPAPARTGGARTAERQQ
jgi:pyruvate/2-oxoglutarate/acetoin dehydrogenase E1 component